MNASLDFVATVLSKFSDPHMGKLVHSFEAGAALAKALTGPSGSDSYMLTLLEDLVSSVKAMLPGDTLLVNKVPLPQPLLTFSSLS